MADKILSFLTSIPLEWQVFILSMFPVTELRASIPIGIAFGLSPFKTWIVAILGNFVPAIPLLLFLKPTIEILRKVPLGGKLIDKIFARTRAKSDKVQKYGVLGLALFVAIPAPGTGLWTGTLLAFLFGIKVVPTVLALILGLLISGTLVTLASVGLLELSRLLSWQMFLLVLALLIAFVTIYWKKYKKKN